MLRQFLLFGFISVLTCGSAADISEGRQGVVVSVDGISVTQDDIRRYIKERIASGVNPETFTTARSIAQAGENILSLKRLGKMAREAGFVSNQQIEWELDLQRERLQYREWTNSLIESEMATTDWTAAAREEYLANPDNYIRGKDEIRSSHILVGLDSRTDEEAKVLAEEVLKRVKAGEEFSALVAEYSDDKSAAKNQGDLGFFSKGRMVPEFEAAAFALTKEQPLSELVKTQFGYHIIKLTDSRKAKRLTFDEAKEDIIVQLKTQAPRAIRNRLTMDARSVSNTDPVVNEAALKELEKEILGGE